MVAGFKFIQVNIFKGKYLDALLEFLKSENPDFISMQEVTSGKLNNYEDKDTNLFELFSQKLSYQGVFHSDAEILGDADASFGNAVFSKWPILASRIVILNTFKPLTFSEFGDSSLWGKFARHMLDVTGEFSGRRLHIISVHCRRIAPPVDNPESSRQANLIAEHLRSLGDKPFILGGDFNMPPESRVIKTISDVSKNLMAGSGVVQTLNPQVHELGEKGYLVDFIFTSRHFKKISIEVPQVTVSDHLPVVARLEI